MPEVEHERARLHAGVDAFIDYLSDDDSDEYDDFKIDTFAIIAIGTWKVDGNEAEAPFQFFETRRNFAKLGLLRTCVIELEGDYYSNAGEPNDEEEGE